MFVYFNFYSKTVNWAWPALEAIVRQNINNIVVQNMCTSDLSRYFMTPHETSANVLTLARWLRWWRCVWRHGHHLSLWRDWRGYVSCRLVVAAAAPRAMLLIFVLRRFARLYARPRSYPFHLIQLIKTKIRRKKADTHQPTTISVHCVSAGFTFTLFAYDESNQAARCDLHWTTLQQVE